MTEAFDFAACARACREVTKLIGDLREMTMERYPPQTGGSDIFTYPDQVLEDLKKAHEATGLALKKMHGIKFPSRADYHEAAEEARRKREAEMRPVRWG
jgi:hypothetical protein